jgi:chromosome segregation ATPase
VAIVVDLVSLVSLLVAGIVGLRAVGAFKQSRQAVTESASLITVIVEALSSRIQRSESALSALREDLAMTARRSERLEGNQGALRAANEEVVRQLQEMLANDKKLLTEVEHLKSKIAGMGETAQVIEGLPKPGNFAAISEENMLASLTPTERRTLDILNAEGAKGAPELGKRLKKSREHTSRLMKKLYMEGYVSRESNRAPFRYKLNDVVRSALEPSSSEIKEEQAKTL